MEKTKIFSMDFFKDFQDKDKFFDNMVNDENMLPRAANLCFLLTVCSFIYGVSMGYYNGLLQALSSGIKVPALLLLSLIICFPAFFINQYALGSHIKFWQIFMIILSGYVVIALILVAFAPIVIFFDITGNNYSFL